MGITNNLVEISEDFLIFGFNIEGDWKEFEIGEDYKAFLLKKK